MKYFEALGVEPTLSLDDADLKKRFLDRTRSWHPDRFTRASVADQQKALDMTALLNDAYRTLRDPVTRAEYYLEEQGVPPSKSAPPELLDEMFEFNMMIEELRGGDESLRPQLQAASDRFRAMQAEIDSHLASQGEHPMSNQELRGLLDRRRYIANLVRDTKNVHLSN